MLVAKYWAEARLQHKFSNRKQKNSQVSIRRLGWSNESQQAAQEHAQQRAHDAMQKALSEPEALEHTVRHEPKPHDGYNGADGLPIREEVVQAWGEDLAITRNSYGALCLNTRHVMFLDIDNDYSPPRNKLSEKVVRNIWLALVAIVWILFLMIIFNDYSNPGVNKCNQPKEPSLISAIVFAIISLFTSFLIASMAIVLFFSISRFVYNKKNPPLKRIDAFSQKHPEWNMNVYQTAAGYRLLILHQQFDPSDEKTWDTLNSLGIDPTYKRMCQLQKCFRARLTPKPWRIGMRKSISHGRRAWQACFAQSLERIQWIADYEKIIPHRATCHLVKQYGQSSDQTHFDVSSDACIEEVRKLHDEVTKANSNLPLA